jgi:hypothetical protein
MPLVNDTETSAFHLRGAIQGLLLVLLAVLTSLLTGCGGGGGGSSSSLPPAPQIPVSTYTPGVFPPSEDFRYLCVNPPDNLPGSPGTRTDENNWLRSWSNELYLWYDEIVDRNPADFTTPEYFELQKTEALTASGAAKDKFHFTIPTEEWIALSQSGESAGYGARFELIAAAPPREVVVAYVDAGTPAATAALARGTTIVAVNGEEVATTANVDLLNDALFPGEAGLTFTFKVRDPGSTTDRDVTLTSEVITTDPVNAVSTLGTASGDVGYLSFTDHIATSEAELIAAVEQFSSAGISDLVLDLRYNSGGFLDIANELAFMIAGAVNASGQVFDQIEFNDKYPTRNPVTNEPLAPDLFHTTTQGFSTTAGIPLPALNLNRVFILSTASTCSASEAIINGLTGIDVEVIQIGTTTCGKPYGFYAFDNCGTSYFSIQFRGINAKGFGDYTDGFSPVDVNGIEGVPLPGCEVADDFSRELGNPDERMLATALSYRETGSCPVQPATALRSTALRKQPVDDSQAISRPRLPGTVRLR